MASKDYPAFVLPLGLLKLRVLLDAQVEEVAEVRVDARLGQLLLSFSLDVPQGSDLCLVPGSLSTVLGPQLGPFFVYCGLSGWDLRPLFSSDWFGNQTIPRDEVVVEIASRGFLFSMSGLCVGTKSSGTWIHEHFG